MTEAHPFSEDLMAAKLAMDKDNFYLMSILGNRIMSNAVFLTQDPKPVLLAGVFVKDVATELLLVSARAKTEPISTARATAKPFLDKIGSMALSGKFDDSAFWSMYEDFIEKVRRFAIVEVEEKSYSANRKFTAIVVEWLVRYLSENKKLLLDHRNQLFGGILNELGRIFRVHGAAKKELVVIVVLGYLEKLYAYVRFASTKTDGTLEPDLVQSEIYPFVEKLPQILKGEDVALTEGTSLLVDLALKWRSYFIRYFELRFAQGVVPEQGNELPEETKKKITEAVTRTMEKRSKSR